MLVGTALSSAIALLAFASNVNAHGHLKDPPATIEDGKPSVEWVTMIDNYWDIGSGGDQVGKFKTMAKEKGMSVKDVVLDMVKDKKCGYTRTDVDPQPVPKDGKVKWWGNGGGGFTHTGPCELYLDDKMVLHGDDCEEEYPGGPDGSEKMSEMPVDFSACKGKCMLTIYWLAFQNEQWQAYVNCVPVQGDGSGTPTQSQTSTAGSSTGDKTPATSNAGSSAQQQTPETPSTEKQSGGGSSKDDQSNEAPANEAPANEAPANEAPANDTPSNDSPSSGNTPSTETQTTEPPATEKQDTKCNAPARRLRKKVTTF
ncbi:hypothetical protein PHMEG_00011627 [Phytophthora megakarya]|uniref:Mucin n=1 Tax=Phytophthora megakarya TaxID=4795 RepID=A0A225WBQ9_9STRA|nr:hypothetical protein PHMEG_00011627 [Phytophthora megakarya]